MLKSILDEQKRWQQVPNRRDPLTTQMLDLLHSSAKQAHPDSYQAALYDWLVIGIQAGFRKSEWCQDTSSLSSSGDIALNVDGSSKAFTRDDFVLESKTKNSTLKYDYLTIRWRFQKNSQNGQTISFAHDYNHPHRSPVTAARNILERAQRLRVPQSSPIAIFKHKLSKHSFSFITHKQVESSLRTLASKIYRITDSKKLQKYSCHSIRVGACVLLHSAQQDPLTIKFRLRWRSDSFMEYLRNTPRLAALHARIASTTNTDNIVL